MIFLLFSDFFLKVHSQKTVEEKNIPKVVL